MGCWLRVARHRMRWRCCWFEVSGLRTSWARVGELVPCLTERLSPKSSSETARPIVRMVVISVYTFVLAHVRAEGALLGVIPALPEG